MNPHPTYRIRKKRVAAASAAAFVTLVAVTGGVLSNDDPGAPVYVSAGGGVDRGPVDLDRSPVVSRSGERGDAADARRDRLREKRLSRQVRREKQQMLSPEPGHVITKKVVKPKPEPKSKSYPVEGNRALGQKMMLEFGWGIDQWPALEALWTRESGWNHLAANPTSSAYGIPQSLPGSKMASAGADWRTNPATQIRWGLGYIKDRYGSPQAALAHSNSVGWY